ncbi:MAG TPA: S-layer homology domain-containing protein, partial [Dissulfurispiraceae bacterium]|nr:S-layer homology domain-containing protein [Dissulfurispiraceae bacterium]
MLQRLYRLFLSRFSTVSATLILGFLIFASAPSNLQASITFSDVSSSYWAYPYIEAIAAAGISNGCGNGEYCPAEEVDREEVAAFIIRALYGENPTCNGGVPCSTTTPYFSDVPATDPYFQYVQKLYEVGITVSSGTFGPGMSVTRDQMAVYLVRAAQIAAGQSTASFTCNGGVAGASVNCSTTTPYFTDEPATDPYFAYVQKLKELGITGAVGFFSPATIATRDEMSMFISTSFLGMRAVDENLYTGVVNPGNFTLSAANAGTGSGTITNNPAGTIVNVSVNGST